MQTDSHGFVIEIDNKLAKGYVRIYWTKSDKCKRDVRIAIDLHFHLPFHRDPHVDRDFDLHQCLPQKDPGGVWDFGA